MRNDNNQPVSFLLKQLKNGSRHPELEIAQAIDSIDIVKSGPPEDFFELVKLCRFPGYNVPQACLQRLITAGIYYRGDVREVVKNVILSSVCGRTLADLEVSSPFNPERVEIFQY